MSIFYAKLRITGRWMGLVLLLFFNLASCKFGGLLYIFARELDLPRPLREPRLFIRARTRAVTARTRGLSRREQSHAARVKGGKAANSQ